MNGEVIEWKCKNCGASLWGAQKIEDFCDQPLTAVICPVCGSATVYGGGKKR